jgi:hypothetical protein
MTTAARNVYVPRQQFIPFHNRPHRWATLVTHRRAGKTVALVNDIIIAAKQRLDDRTAAPTALTDPLTNKQYLRYPALIEPQYAYIGPTYKQAKRIAWAYLKRYSTHLWAKPPNESELYVTIRNEGGAARIYCLGADNADSLRGMYLDGVVCDEYALFKPSVFSQILRPALSDRNGWAVFSSTPRGKNIFHEQYRRALKDPARHFLLTLSASTSGIIRPAELKDLQLDMDAEEFAQEYLCSFDSALKGAIYAKEINDVITTARLSPTPLYDPNLDTHFVYDLGFTDSTVRIAYQLPPLTGRVNIVNVLAKNGVSIFEHIDDIFSFGGPVGTIWLPHDARAKNLQTGKSIVEQFLEHDLTPRIVPNHHVHDGISTTRRLFPRLHFDAHPYDPSDPYGENPTEDLVEACRQYHREWDEEKLIFTDQPVHDWASDYCDALRYLAVVVSPDLQLDALPSSSDNAVQSARLAARANRPHLGYNLETLHMDNSSSQRAMP